MLYYFFDALNVNLLVVANIGKMVKNTCSLIKHESCNTEKGEGGLLGGYD